jgi:hypothetical protein
VVDWGEFTSTAPFHEVEFIHFCLSQLSIDFDLLESENTIILAEVCATEFSAERSREEERNKKEKHFSSNLMQVHLL